MNKWTIFAVFIPIINAHNRVLIYTALLFYASSVFAQDSLLKYPSVEVNGYIKSLQIWSFPKHFEKLDGSNLLHHRLNSYFNFSKQIRAAVSFRNRLLWGEELRQYPNYSKYLRNPNEWMNLSVVWIQRPDWILHTNTERLWLEYRSNRWNMRAGRQRINWGITTTWNPNDLFNTYNFLDVDYEERPGSEAFVLNYQLNSVSQIETAIDPGKTNQQRIAAVRYNTNYRSTDYQLIIGSYQQRFTAGGGWAGSIGDAGFKGEVQYFMKSKTESQQWNLSMEVDYALEKGWYLQAGWLWNSTGQRKNFNDSFPVSQSLSPRRLMPTRNNALLYVMKELNPRFSIQWGLLYAPGSNLLIFFPRIECNLSKNLDVDLVWQSFFAEREEFEALNHRGFLRFRWSY